MDGKRIKLHDEADAPWGGKVSDTGRGRGVAAMSGGSARLAWLPAVFSPRDTRTTLDVVHRLTMCVFVHSPQTQKYLLGKALIPNAPSSGRIGPSDCGSNSSSLSVPSRR